MADLKIQILIALVFLFAGGLGGFFICFKITLNVFRDLLDREDGPAINIIKPRLWGKGTMKIDTEQENTIQPKKTFRDRMRGRKEKRKSKTNDNS